MGRQGTKRGRWKDVGKTAFGLHTTWHCNASLYSHITFAGIDST